MNILEALNWRYAVKSFSDAKISAKQLRQLLNATRLTASSYGLQPYVLIVVESDTIRQQLIPFSYGQDKIAQCSHLIVLAVHTQIGDITVDSYIDKVAQLTDVPHSTLSGMSEHMKLALSSKSTAQQQEWAHQQAYLALGNLLTCAALMKIDTCPMTGIDSSGYDEVLGLKAKGLTTSVICPIGKRDPDDIQAVTPKVRFDYEQLVMVV